MPDPVHESVRRLQHAIISPYLLGNVPVGERSGVPIPSTSRATENRCGCQRRDEIGGRGILLRGRRTAWGSAVMQRV